MNYEAYEGDHGYHYNNDINRGYMNPSSAGDTNSQYYNGNISTSTQNPNSGIKNQNRRGNQIITPVSIKQLKLASQNTPDDVYRIDSQEIHTIKIIGLILEIQEQSTSVLFNMTDGTGEIPAKMFVQNSEYMEDHIGKFKKGMYVRIVGSLRSYQNQISISIFSIAPVEDFNMLTCHLLETIYSSLYNIRGPLINNNETNTNQYSFQNTTPLESNSNIHSNTYNYSNTNNTNYSNYNNNMNTNSNHSSDPQELVLNELRKGSEESSIGLTREELIQRLSGRLTAAEVINTFNILLNEGGLYSTSDEYHFSPAI